MVRILGFLIAASMLPFLLIVLPLLCLMPTCWKDEYAPGFCGVGAIVWSAVGLVPALIAAGLVLVRFAELDPQTRLIGLAPVVILCLAITATCGLLSWHERRPKRPR